MPDHQPGTYRVGTGWHGRTIVRVGHQTPDPNGRRPDDQLIAHVDSAAPEGWAAQTCALHNGTASDSEPSGPNSELTDDDWSIGAYRIYSRWFKAGDRSIRAVHTAIQEAYAAGRAAGASQARADTPPGPPRSTETAQQPTAGGTGSTEGSTAVSAGCDTVHLIRDGNATTACCYRTPFELRHGEGHRLTGNPDAVTCGLTPRHGTVI